jgi:tetratricopeptide (TPR) repeat protein
VADQPAGEPRYRLLETVRAYATERLAAAGEAERVAAAHAAWCIAEADLSQTRLRGPDQLVWWTRAHAEQANLRAGLRFMLERGEAAGAVRLAGALAWHQGFFGGFFGQPDESLADLRAALALPGGPSDRARAEALATQAWLGMRTGDGPDAFERRTAEAVASFRAACDTAHAELVASLGRAMLERMRQAEHGELGPAGPATAPERLDRAVLDRVLAEEAWTHTIAWYAMVTVMRLALEQAAAGDFAGARRDAEALLDRLRRRGDRLGTIDCLELLAGISSFQGDFDRARACLRESLRLACELRYPAEMAVQLGRLGEIELARGDTAAARAALEQALVAFEQFGMPDMAASIGNALGMASTAEGDLPAAAARHQAALERYRQLGDELGAVASEALLALLAVRRGEHGRAGAMLDAALATARRSGNSLLAAFVLEAMGVLAASMGDARRAALLFGATVWQSSVGSALILGRRVVPAPMAPTLREEAVAAVRAALGDQGFEAALAEGRELGPDRVAAAQASRR